MPIPFQSRFPYAWAIRLVSPLNLIDFDLFPVDLPFDMLQELLHPALRFESL